MDAEFRRALVRVVAGSIAAAGTAVALAGAGFPGPFALGAGVGVGFALASTLFGGGLLAALQ